jgi:RhtB (resistance to homoserine/threonine) family protein
MVDFVVLFKIMTIMLLALVSPGPDFMIVTSLSLTRGRGDGIKAAAGIASVIFIYTIVSLTGLSALFERYLWLMIAVKICGGLYLLYLGFLMWKASLARQKDEHLFTPTEIKKKNAYLAGALTSLTNPKAIAFFASVFALALTPTTSIATKTAIAVAMPLLTLAWFSFVAFALSKPAVRTRYQRWQRVIDRVTGTVLGFFGLKLIISARS